MADFRQLPPITCGALSTATLMYPVDLVRALKMSAAAEGRGGTAGQLIREFHATRTYTATRRRCPNTRAHAAARGVAMTSQLACVPPRVSLPRGLHLLGALSGVCCQPSGGPRCICCACSAHVHRVTTILSFRNVFPNWGIGRSLTRGMCRRPQGICHAGSSARDDARHVHACAQVLPLPNHAQSHVWNG